MNAGMQRPRYGGTAAFHGNICCQQPVCHPFVYLPVLIGYRFLWGAGSSVMLPLPVFQKSITPGHWSPCTLSIMCMYVECNQYT